ncbi:MAG: hypothetical protein ACI4WS_10540 [Oscillospiraceae bacterium]
MAVKTISLTGAEVAVTGLDGAHAHIRNDGADTIYAAKTAGITEGASGVASVPAGHDITIYGITGTVYLKGTGSVLVVSSDYVQSPFGNSTASGGSAVDEQARTAISTHAGNADIHVTSEDKSLLNAVKFNTHNLLTNPDFAINQRGVSGTITATGYFVDRWKLVSGSVTINYDGTLTLNGSIQQILETAAGENTAASASAGTASYDNSTRTFTLTASGETVEWAKLEAGSVATPYSPPDPAVELAKCQRYCVVLAAGRYGRASFVGTSVIQFDYTLPQPMRATPTIESGILGVIALNNSTAAQADTSFAFSVGSLKCNHLLIQATKSDSAMDSALYATDRVVLSADL